MPSLLLTGEYKALIKQAEKLVHSVTDYETLMHSCYNEFNGNQFVQVYFEKDLELFEVDIQIKKGVIITTPQEIANNIKPVTL